MAVQLWKERKQIAEALKNANVRIGERSTPKGALRGLYATKAFARDDYVASFHGKLISTKDLFELGKTDKDLFAHINENAARTPHGDHLYPPDPNVLGGHLINHSCGPNAVLKGFEHGALLVRAVRPIATGEEITIHYGWVGVKAAMEKSRHPCACQASLCAGTIELKIEFLKFDDNTGGPYLPPEEATLRFLIDIANDTSENEETLYAYSRNSISMLHGAKEVEGIDHEAFFRKLQDAAAAAILTSAKLAGEPSARRLAQIARRYNLPL